MSASPTADAVIAFIRDDHANTALGEMGVEYTDFNPDAVCAEVAVSPKLFRHGGVVHGGIYVLLGESTASTAAALSVDMRTHEVSGMEINANHLRPVTKGRLRCVATPVHRGRTTHVYAYAVHDDDGRPVCVGRCTVAVRQRDS